MSLLGGFSAEAPADAEVKSLFETPEIIAVLSSQLGYAVTSFVVDTAAKQVVAGLNYSLHGTVEGGPAGPVKVHIKAFKPLPHTGNPMEVKEVHVVA